MFPENHFCILFTNQESGSVANIWPQTRLNHFIFPCDKTLRGFPQSKCVYYLLCHLDLQRASVRIEKCHFFFNRQMWFITQSVEWARQNYSPTFPLRGLARPKSLFWLEAFSLVCFTQSNSFCFPNGKAFSQQRKRFLLSSKVEKTW